MYFNEQRFCPFEVPWPIDVGAGTSIDMHNMLDRDLISYLFIKVKGQHEKGLGHSCLPVTE